jgi:hypothetical protein
MVCFLQFFGLFGGFMKKDKIPVFNEIKIVATGYTRPGAQNAENEVNRLLQTGWVLLETYTTCYSNTILYHPYQLHKK